MEAKTKTQNPGKFKFKFLPHVADVKFQAWGKTLEEAFSSAALATISVMIDPTTIEPAITKNIIVKGGDLKSLLYNFLEELLVLLDTESFLLHEVTRIAIDRKGKEYFLNATVVGDRIDEEKYETKGDVKAVTYNDMFVKEEKGRCTVQVVLDV